MLVRTGQFQSLKLEFDETKVENAHSCLTPLSQLPIQDYRHHMLSKQQGIQLNNSNPNSKSTISIKTTKRTIIYHKYELLYKRKQA